eukprot:CAMPEP_0196683314 /NCGR_PEP_ID=MMETSP1090-20130531/9820_1 /TAXON_ID=37098 /ORGANISM="Isochrysis sp, Strain CCMP1244" /LENGTH=152 /DNA_ID=CAMNT_0042021753 /DNA_START=700 /DNA_END=1155 /DNA_ORIENTATION=-
MVVRRGGGGVRLTIPRAPPRKQVLDRDAEVLLHRRRAVQGGRLGRDELLHRRDACVRRQRAEADDRVALAASRAVERHAVRRRAQHAIRHPLENVAEDDHKRVGPHRRHRPPSRHVAQLEPFCTLVHECQRLVVGVGPDPDVRAAAADTIAA